MTRVRVQRKKEKKIPTGVHTYKCATEKYLNYYKNKNITIIITYIIYNKYYSSRAFQTILLKNNILSLLIRRSVI